uniref:Uncharacterized protein n=1 Tax=Lepeophtheirus salmonis TaxID=72036 RepID=A0A0K2UCQ3_LEPSM
MAWSQKFLIVKPHPVQRSLLTKTLSAYAGITLFFVLAAGQNCFASLKKTKHSITLKKAGCHCCDACRTRLFSLLNVNKSFV